ncbi:Hypothetical predicted protein [Olea europaea subsp. europaea]|uniref:Uncharacterized protein n=1 Tax=Olea europaea subsp. europaea TaxID=158383 RepID=A0A8S0Q541_OLEEU|nr:Hypothetical predicted protein [Olea europaea subsp. europaea]
MAFKPCIYALNVEAVIAIRHFPAHLADVNVIKAYRTFTTKTTTLYHTTETVVYRHDHYTAPHNTTKTITATAPQPPINQPAPQPSTTSHRIANDNNQSATLVPKHKSNHTQPPTPTTTDPKHESRTKNPTPPRRYANTASQPSMAPH